MFKIPLFRRFFFFVCASKRIKDKFFLLLGGNSLFFFLHVECSILLAICRVCKRCKLVQRKKSLFFFFAGL